MPFASFGGSDRTCNDCSKRDGHELQKPQSATLVMLHLSVAPTGRSTGIRPWIMSSTDDFPPFERLSYLMKTGKVPPDPSMTTVGARELARLLRVVHIPKETMHSYSDIGGQIGVMLCDVSISTQGQARDDREVIQYDEKRIPFGHQQHGTVIQCCLGTRSERIATDINKKIAKVMDWFVLYNYLYLEDSRKVSDKSHLNASRRFRWHYSDSIITKLKE
ncbi:hypothetical protein F5884DRAFT_834110 [Xylogone sp. PMI_703]|nr:hypothetical protein F5884DRAFT_834110 [Xylogone sp. PMI_703]